MLLLINCWLLRLSLLFAVRLVAVDLVSGYKFSNTLISVWLDKVCLIGRARWISTCFFVNIWIWFQIEQTFLLFWFVSRPIKSVFQDIWNAWRTQTVQIYLMLWVWFCFWINGWPNVVFEWYFRLHNLIFKGTNRFLPINSRDLFTSREYMYVFYFARTLFKALCTKRVCATHMYVFMCSGDFATWGALTWTDGHCVDLLYMELGDVENSKKASATQMRLSNWLRLWRRRRQWQLKWNCSTWPKTMSHGTTGNNNQWTDIRVSLTWNSFR